MGSSTVLVTGGTGSLGRQVVERLRAAGDNVTVMSRSGRAGIVRADLATGEGLDEALRGVDTVVHCASSPAGKMRETDIGGTRRLLQAAARARATHLLYISIVGVGQSSFPYYRAKREAERLVEQSSVPWTILRATQFHELVYTALAFLSRVPGLTPVPGGFVLQPIDSGEVADRLTELAHTEPAGRVPDVGGPQVATTAELTRAYLEASGQQRRLVQLPLPGKTARAFREGDHTCPDDAYGSVRWQDFLRHRT